MKSILIFLLCLCLSAIWYINSMLYTSLSLAIYSNFALAAIALFISLNIAAEFSHDEEETTPSNWYDDVHTMD